MTIPLILLLSYCILTILYIRYTLLFESTSESDITIIPIELMIILLFGWIFYLWIIFTKIKNKFRK